MSCAGEESGDVRKSETVADRSRHPNAVAGFDSQHPLPISSDGRPRLGSPVTYNGRAVGNVTAVEGNLCWHSGGDLFIWRFRDGLNALHDWPGKCGLLAPCPGLTA